MPILYETHDVSPLTIKGYVPHCCTGSDSPRRLTYLTATSLKTTNFIISTDGTFEMCIGTIIVKTLHKKVQGFDQEMQELDDV